MRAPLRRTRASRSASASVAEEPKTRPCSLLDEMASFSYAGPWWALASAGFRGCCMRCEDDRCAARLSESRGLLDRARRNLGRYLDGERG